MPPKKRKLSGLSGLELQMAHDAVFKLTTTFIFEESDGATNQPATESDQDDFEDHVHGILALFKSRLEGPNALSFSGMNTDNLTKLKIVSSGHISLKLDLDARIAATTSLGENELWSSKNLYRQLNLLESLIPRKTEASARAWIDAFFFRSTAMLSSDKRMVLNMEHAIPSIAVNPTSFVSLAGYIDYTAVVANPHDAALFLGEPKLSVLKQDMPSSSGLFVVEAKLHDPLDHVPQAVSEIYACAKHLEKQVVRGALTNGRAWIFLIVKLKDDGDGASYKRSEPIELETSRLGLRGPRVMSEPYPDLIAAILSHWIQNSFVDLAGDDWFEVYVGV